MVLFFATIDLTNKSFVFGRNSPTICIIMLDIIIVLDDQNSDHHTKPSAMDIVYDLYISIICRRSSCTY